MASMALKAKKSDSAASITPNGQFLMLLVHAVLIFGVLLIGQIRPNGVYDTV